MNPLKGVAIAVIVAGALGLMYGGFSYTKENHTASIGSLTLTVKDKEHVNVPVWVGLGTIVIGAGMLLMPPKK